MSFEKDRKGRDVVVAQDAPLGAPGKRGQTDRLSVPVGQTATATGTGAAHESALTGTGWLSGVLGFSSTSGRSVGDPETAHDDKDKKKDKSKKDGEHEHAEDESESGGDDAGFTMTVDTIGSNEGESSSDDSSTDTSGDSDGSGGEGEAAASHGETSGEAQGAGGHPAAPTPKIEHHTQKLAPGNADDTRRKIAVGELVDFSSTVAGDWIATTGTATGPSSTTFTWTAPATPGTAVISCIVGTKKVSKTFTVIAPNHLKFKKFTETPVAAGTQGSGMQCNLTVGPSSVCFGNVQWLEIPGPASNVWGYFAGNVGDLQHHPNPAWLQWSDTNDGLMDTASFWGYPAPWKAGGWTWVIPNHYQVVGSAFSNHFVTTYQVFTMTKNGTSRVTKGGQSSAPRKP